MIKMRALFSFDDQRIKPRQVSIRGEFEAESAEVAGELERAGLATRIESKAEPKAEVKPEPKAAAKKK